MASHTESPVGKLREVCVDSQPTVSSLNNLGPQPTVVVFTMRVALPSLNHSRNIVTKAPTNLPPR